jgi:hypothetical protein
MAESLENVLQPTLFTPFPITCREDEEDFEKVQKMLASVLKYVAIPAIFTFKDRILIERFLMGLGMNLNTGIGILD